MTDPNYIVLTEATARLGIDPQAVYRARGKGKLPFVRRFGSGKGYFAIALADLPKLARAFGVEVPAP